MAYVARLVFALTITVVLFAAAVSQPAKALAADVAMASMPCCDDDCPDDPACSMACMAMLRCTTGSVGLVPPLPFVKLSLYEAGDAHGADPPLRVDDLHPEALRRPPRT